MGCPATCLRLTIVITDFILWILGISILAIGSFLKLSNYVQYTLDPTTSRLLEYTTQTDLQFNHFSWVLIILGIIFVFTAILGACSVNNGQYLLVFYSCLVLCLMLLQTSLFLIYSGYLGRKDSDLKNLSGFYENTIFTKIPTYLDNSFRAIFRSALNLDKSDIVEGYDVSPIGTTIISIQNRMHCCGYFNACDYCSIQGEENVFTKELSSSFLNVNKVVRKCEDVDNRCKNICPAGQNDQNEQKSSFQTGCKEAFQTSFKNKQLLFESIIMSWLILQFLVSFFAIFLCCVNRKIYKDKQEFKDNHIRYQNEEYAYNYKTGAALRPDNSYSHNNQNSQNINFNDDSIDQNTAQYQSYKKVMPSSSSYLDTTLTRNMNYNRNNSNNNFITGHNLDVIKVIF